MELGELQSVYDSLVAAALAHDADAYAGHFTDRGVIMVPHSPAVVGRAAVKRWIGALFEAWTLEIAEVSFEDVTIGDRVAFVRFAASGRYVADDGREVPFQHKYLDALVKEGGRWLFAAHTASTIDETESLWKTFPPDKAA